jgi:hypothetical protein
LLLTVPTKTPSGVAPGRGFLYAPMLGKNAAGHGRVYRLLSRDNREYARSRGPEAHVKEKAGLKDYSLA